MVRLPGTGPDWFWYSGTSMYCAGNGLTVESNLGMVLEAHIFYRSTESDRREAPR